MWNSPTLLNTVSVVALWIAAIAGGVTVVASFVGGMAASRASDLTKNEAEIKIAEANARADEAHLKARQIEQNLAWRTLTPEQRHILVAHLRGKVNKVWNSWVGNDPEATQYREQMESALHEAGIETQYFSGWDAAAGVGIIAEPGSELNALHQAFLAAGIPHWTKQPSADSGNFGKDVPCIVIGTRAGRL